MLGSDGQEWHKGCWPRLPRGSSVWVGLGTLCMLVFVHFTLHHAQVDFEAFYRAGARALGAEPLYIASEGIAFKYAPAAALLFAPLALLPFQIANAIWAMINCVALVAFFRLCRKAVGANSRWGLPLVVALTSPFWSYLLMLGQSDAVVLALLAAGELRATTKPSSAGAMDALAALFKLPALIWILFNLARGQRSRALASALWFGLGIILPALRYGVAGWWQLMVEWRSLLSATTPEGLCSPHNQGLFALTCTYLFDASVTPTPPYFAWVLGAAAAIALILSVALLLLHRHHAADARTAVLAVAFYSTSLFSPLAWRTGLLAVAPMIFLAVRAFEVDRRVLPRWILGLVWAPLLASALLNYDTVGDALFRTLLAGRMFGLSALAGVLGTALTLAWFRVRSAPAQPQY